MSRRTRQAVRFAAATIARTMRTAGLGRVAAAAAIMATTPVAVLAFDGFQPTDLATSLTFGVVIGLVACLLWIDPVATGGVRKTNRSQDGDILDGFAAMVRNAVATAPHWPEDLLTQMPFSAPTIGRVTSLAAGTVSTLSACAWAARAIAAGPTVALVAVAFAAWAAGIALLWMVPRVLMRVSTLRVVRRARTQPGQLPAAVVHDPLLGSDTRAYLTQALDAASLAIALDLAPTFAGTVDELAATTRTALDQRG